jgi:hypothetical protein
MNDIVHARSYPFHALDLKISCSAAIAESLDSRFRLVPADRERRPAIWVDFHTVADGSQHRVQKPQGQGRAFYELPSGQAVYFEASDEIYVSFGDGVRALAEPRWGRASFSVVEPGPVNVFMASHLLLTIVLVEMMKRRDCYGIHAAGFSRDGKAILIPGTSGAGKSTLAITLLRSGFGYLSDDMVFLCRRAGGLEILGFPEDVDVSDRTIEFFPELYSLRESPRAPGWPKKQVRADEIYRAELVRESRPGAMVIPKISGKTRSTVRPIDADEALRELVSNVLLTETRSCQEHLNILTELVRQTPCYRLETGQDFDRIPALFQALLSGSREEVHA